MSSIVKLYVGLYTIKEWDGVLAKVEHHKSNIKITSNVMEGN